MRRSGPSCSWTVTLAARQPIPKPWTPATFCVVWESTAAPDEDARSLTYADVGRRLGESYGPAAALTADQLRRIAEGYARSTRLSTRFAPRVFRGDALLLTAADSSRAVGAPSVNAGLGHSITGTVQDERVDCAHNDMMQPGPARAIGVLVETYVSGRGG